MTGQRSLGAHLALCGVGAGRLGTGWFMTNKNGSRPRMLWSWAYSGNIALQPQNAAAAAKSPPSCLTPHDPMDCSPPGSSTHGIFQARVLEWGAIAFSDDLRIGLHKFHFTILFYFRLL